MEHKFKKSILSLAVAGTFSLVSFQGFAQELEEAEVVSQETASEANSYDVEVEEVVVTGSRISRPNAVTTAPVTSLTAEDLSRSGEVNLGDFLNKLPQLRSTFSSNNSGRFIGTAGLNILDLRGLGTERTLVLQDGRRHIASSIGTSSVDINTIPEDLVERVDVVTAGASALYGADAVSGVINFIMKDDFEGGKISAFTSDTQHGGGESTELTLTLGKNFFDGRANIAGNIGYTKTGELRGLQRGWIRKNYGTQVNPNDTGPHDGIPDFIPIENSVFPVLSDTGILFGLDSDGRLQQLDYIFNPDGSLRPTISGDCDVRNRCIGGDGYTGLETSQLALPTENTNLFVTGHFDVSDSMRLFAEAKYVNREAESLSTASFSRDLIDPNNPFLDPAAAEKLQEFVDQGLTPGAYRIHNDLGFRTDVTERSTQRYVLGLKGDIGGNWEYEASLVYGQYNGDTTFLNNRHNDRYAQALDAIELNGEIVCADADARANGCVPLNLFGSGRASQEAIDYVSLQNTGAEEEMTQFVVSGFIGGEIFQLPAGPLSVVGGLEYREETSEVDYSEVIKADLTFMNALQRTTGEYDVSEAYVEMSAPLVGGLPGIELLTLDAAYRISDYSTVGDTNAWNVGFSWVIVDSLRFRATTSEAVRAPNIDELFGPLTENFAFVDDPCDADELKNAPDVAQRSANCAALGLSPDYQSPWNEGATLGYLSGGNPDLGVETAKTTSFGLVFTPSFADGLTVIVDYWDIEIEDAISAYGAQTILDKCVDAASINNVFCGNIGRLPNGDIAEGALISSALNAAALTARGIDYEVRYQFALADLFNTSDLGSLTLAVTGSHLKERIDYSFQDEPDEGDRIDRELGDPTNSFNTDVTYDYGNLSLNWRHRYVGDMALYDLGNRPPESVAISNTGSVNYDNLRAAYVFNDDLEVYGGINNIGDQEPPANLSGAGGGSAIYDVYGRSFYVGANYTF
ncbi:TonB-dependent receptor domain-containing protein [Microbulbifer sp. 2304DJ12-6]|uniref:TonB-dependent receptor domain-containing protein n=1 Tax=Microbulbifer sp. 2304DJ12-6 TaxID=3233340 RepID=UPI0039AED56A